MSGPLPVWLPETAVNGSGRQRATTDGRPLADEGQRNPAPVSRRTICTGVQSSPWRSANPAQIPSVAGQTA